MAAEQHAWWQRGVIYQVYPLSFQDSGGDGFGDLPGLLARLDYLQWLGVDALWLSPIYPSPMGDWGYDVADYCDVDPRFGTLADLDALIAEAHRRGLRVLLDFVPNHTSDQHPWFIESQASRANPRRDWYHWRDPAPSGGPPNNWISVFGGSAWELDAPTGQYYHHSFLRQQPDLDWRHPEVRAAMHEALRFWLRRGVDGFRVDVIHHLAKDPELRDNPPNPEWAPGQNPYRRLLATHTADLPAVHEVIAGLRAVVDEFPDRMLIGELYLPLERLMLYYGAGGSGLQLPFNFQLIRRPWEAQALGTAIEAYEAMLPTFGWPNWVLGNHDKSRVASRVGAAQARVAAMMLLTLRGTPTLYYGDEIGMRDVPIPPERVRDPFEQNVPGLGLGRDPERTPMQWGGGPHAGFTKGEPWLPVAADAATVNVERQRDDRRSLLTLYRRLLALRRAEPALAVGPFAPLRAPGDLLAWVRKEGDRRFLVVLNLGHEPATFTPPVLALDGDLVLSTHLDRDGERVLRTVELRGDEGVIVRLG
ncbi:MAG TPA: alpha-amylase family glycosyl hydrolase [Thermoanaerobaculia bacterium]|nr:alpha-amylase family glycosyl hydrolase [Thermoanaerobaculia bacterium]